MDLSKEIAAKIHAQYEYRQRTHLPPFAPSDGICYNCRKQIYNEKGISLKEAGERLTTACPFCHTSYVE